MTNSKARNRAAEAFKVLASRNVTEYFNQWKAATERFKIKLNTSVKDRIIKAYLNSLRSSFDKWKVGAQGKKIDQHQMVVMDQEE